MAARDPRRFDDLFDDFGPVSLRRLFSGEGIYSGGIIIGIVIDDRIYLKTSEATRPAFTAEGCKPFCGRGQSRETVDHGKRSPARPRAPRGLQNS